MFLLAQRAKNLAAPLRVSSKCVVSCAYWYDGNALVYKITNHIYSHTHIQTAMIQNVSTQHSYVHTHIPTDILLLHTDKSHTLCYIWLALSVLRMMLEMQTVGVLCYGTV